MFFTDEWKDRVLNLERNVAHLLRMEQLSLCAIGRHQRPILMPPDTQYLTGRLVCPICRADIETEKRHD